MDTTYQPHPRTVLLERPMLPGCRAIVIVPARNEECGLAATLDALRLQVDGYGWPIAADFYEVIVLLNNCTDGSSGVARDYAARHTGFCLHVAEIMLAADVAHVGTARRILMDVAYLRLAGAGMDNAAILSTDADTTVAPDWVYRNLLAIESGAEVVGGVIHLKPEDLSLLDHGTLESYRRDRHYQRCVARLESLLDPDPNDPWPRHLEHFGASLACTPEVYRRAGGLPPVKPLEDVAFVDALRRVDARIRHAPEVGIYTSARLDGRAEVGLSGQLKIWQVQAAAGKPHIVQSAAKLAHRFSSMATFRRLWAMESLPSLIVYPRCWREPLTEAHPRGLQQAAFLVAIDCDRLIEQTFRGVREGHISRVIADLNRAITRAQRQKTPCVPAHPTGTSRFAATERFATPAD